MLVSWSALDAANGLDGVVVGDGVVVRRSSTASWCVEWRRLRGASEADGFIVRRRSTASWCVGGRRLCGASNGDGFVCCRVAGG